jgi:carbamate kinase
MEKLAVIALGGNALSRGNEAGTIEQQEKNTENTMVHLVGLIKKGFNLVITHGNGPQVGNILLRNEAGFTQYNIPKMPLDVCVADSQGGIGYMIEKELRNSLKEHNINKNVISIITQVIVDKKDTAFQNPTKPVGAFYTKEEADNLAEANKWVFKEDPRKRGWRRIVASPKPIDVLNKELIKRLASEGNIVIAAGGGGIPVYLENGRIEPIEAVIDKDLASSLLATEIGADAFFILTDVPKAFIHFNKPEQKALDVLTLKEAKQYSAQGEFASGSMGPKIIAAIEFVENGGLESIITEATQLNDSNCGTRIISEN